MLPKVSEFNRSKFGIGLERIRQKKNLLCQTCPNFFEKEKSPCFYLRDSYDYVRRQKRKKKTKLKVDIASFYMKSKRKRMVHKAKMKEREKRTKKKLLQTREKKRNKLQSSATTKHSYFPNNG